MQLRNLAGLLLALSANGAPGSSAPGSSTHASSLALAPTVTTPFPTATIPPFGVSSAVPDASTPSPMQTPSYQFCAQFYQAKPGDSCSSIAAAFGIDAAMFETLNPVVGWGGVNCAQQIWAGYNYCVKSKPAEDIDYVPVSGGTMPVQSPTACHM